MVYLIPQELIRLRDEEDRVCDVTECSIDIAMCGCPFPNDLASKVHSSEDRIKQQLEVMGGGRVAVEVERAGGFEDTAQFDEARGHHREVCNHVAAAEKSVEGLHHVGDFAGLFRDGVVGFPGFDVPMPGVFKGVNLTGGGCAVLFLKEGVV